MIVKHDETADAVDWTLTTWKGARREQMRLWAEMPLEQVIRALEEMQRLAEALCPASDAPVDVDSGTPTSRRRE